MINIGITSIFLFTGCSSSQKILSVKPNEHMEIGWTPRSILQAPPYSVWFDSGYAAYQPDKEYIDKLKNFTDEVEMFVVYATWCPDSKREMPRFFKIMDEVHFPPAKITLIAVDRSKKIPEGIAEEYNITHVPTFIVKYRGLEVGRLIEVPKTKLEQDFVDFLLPFHQ